MCCLASQSVLSFIFFIGRGLTISVLNAFAHQHKISFAGFVAIELKEFGKRLL